MQYVAVFLATVLAEDRCTTIVGGKDTTVDGSTFATHSNDCSNCDFRVTVVPARDYEEGELRPVYNQALTPGFPRLVDPKRAGIYDYKNSETNKESHPMGYIPQVLHTYALYESSYSLMNEKGLALGESTAASILDGRPISEGGKALFCIASLMAIALERCDTALCAVETMGHLSEKYGFFGEEDHTGEAISIVDQSGSAWMWHVTAVKDGASAAWVAQRIPDNHIAVSTNAFAIREVPEKTNADFRFSANLRSAAKEHGLWTSGPFDFFKVYGYDAPWTTSPTVSPFYTSLRHWRVFSRVAPSQTWIPYASSFKYPFSVAVEKKLTMRDVMALHQDFFEDTPFDSRKGVLAGPFGLPYRQECSGDLCPYFNGKSEKHQGQMLRGMTIPRTNYVMIGQSNHKFPKVWFAPDMPTTSVFMPLYCQNLFTEEAIATPYKVGSQKEFKFGESAWWAHDFVANWMTINFKNMSERYVYPVRDRWQVEVMDRAEAAEKKAPLSQPLPQAIPEEGESELSCCEEEEDVNIEDEDVPKEAGVSDVNVGILETATDVKLAETRNPLLSMQVNAQRDVSQAWWDLATTLIVRYNDGFLNFETPNSVDRLTMDGEFLEKTGFSCNSMFSMWPYPHDNVLPWNLNELQFVKDDLERPREAPLWTQCAPGSVAEEIAVKMARSPSQTDYIESESAIYLSSIFSYIAYVALGVIIFLAGVFIGRNIRIRKETPAGYQKMPE